MSSAPAPARTTLALALHAVTVLQTYAAWASHTGGSTTWTVAWAAGACITTTSAFTALDRRQDRP